MWMGSSIQTIAKLIVHSIILSLCMQRCYGCHNISCKICKPLVVYQFYCMTLFHSQTGHHLIIMDMFLIILFQRYFKNNVVQN